MGMINKTSDSVAVASDSGSVVIDGIAYTPLRVKANVAASQTDSSIVAAVAGARIRVLSYQLLTGATATDVTFNTKPAGAGTAISMLHACGANSGIASGFVPMGFFQTNNGEGLTVTTGAGSTTGIQVQYIAILLP